MSNLRASLICALIFVGAGLIENWSVAALVGGISFLYSRGILS